MKKKDDSIRQIAFAVLLVFLLTVIAITLQTFLRDEFCASYYGNSSACSPALVGKTFQELTSSPGKGEGIGMVASAKEYPGAEKTSLPEPSFGSTGLGESLENRRSERSFSQDPLSLEELSALLFAAQGTTSESGLRTAPSAGALYPLEVYVIALNIEGLSGAYHYNIGEHALEKISSGDYSSEVSAAALSQTWISGSGCVIVFTAFPERTTSKYGQRAYRYIYTEAGHASQNLLLAATALDLASCPVGAFYDKNVASLLGIKGDSEQVIYLNVVGKKQS